MLRPADANEIASAYRAALALDRQPAALVLTRQNVNTIDRDRYASPEGVMRGAYVLLKADEPNVILIGTGSEVQLCLDAAELLAAQGILAQVVSMPSWELFEQQDEAYRREVLPPAVVARVAVEAGVRQGWDRYIGQHGEFVGMSGFGASAPWEQLYHHFEITVDSVVRAAQRAIGRPH